MSSAYEKYGSWVSFAFGDPSNVIDARELESRNVDEYRKYVWDVEEEVTVRAQVSRILKKLNYSSADLLVAHLNEINIFELFDKKFNDSK